MTYHTILLYTIYYIVYIYYLYIVYCMLQIAHHILCMVYCTLYMIYPILYMIYYVLYIGARRGAPPVRPYIAALHAFLEELGAPPGNVQEGSCPSPCIHS